MTALDGRVLTDQALVSDQAATRLDPSGFDPSRGGAEISPCGQYRYKLWRHWDAKIGALPIIMLNPSTADASVDDPTIRRCMAFAKREGFGGIHVVNLFPYRATSPDAMRAVSDPWGPGGNYALEEVLANADGPVLAAWGAHGAHRGHDAMVLLSAKGHGTKLVCLGVTKDGHPRHPLYVKGEQPFEPFPRDSDTRRMAETGTGSVRSTGSAGRDSGIAQEPSS